MKLKKLVVLMLAIVASFMFTITASAQPSDPYYTGWHNENGKWYYYSYGTMATDEWIEDTNGMCYVGSDGVMKTNEWIENYGEWYYVGANGARYEDGVYQIGNYYYGFNWNGQLHVDTSFGIEKYDEELGKWVYSYYRAQSGNGRLYQSTWYESEYGDRYYYGADCKAVSGLQTIGGRDYCFDNEGRMLTDDLFEVVVDGVNKHYAVDEEGYPYEIYNNTWTEVNGYWYYVLNGEACESDVYKIGNYYYGFGWNGQLYVDTSFGIDKYDEELGKWVYSYYRAQSGNGRLYQSTWYESEYGDWYYYGADCKAANGLQTIGGKTYYFSYNGRMLQDEAVEVTVGNTKKYYIADENGMLYEAYNNTWKQVKGEWYYVLNGEFCCEGVYKIGGKYYGFNWKGQMYTDTSFSIDKYDEERGEWVYSYYRAKADGTLYQSAWYENEYGYWYYYGADYKAVSGLQTIGGKKYYFYEDGCMLQDEARAVVVGSTTKYYIADKDGKLYETYNNSWKQVNGYWYYVQSGKFCRDGVYKIGGKYYGFNWEGQMYVDTGFSIYEGYDEELEASIYSYYHAKADGVLYQNEWDERNGYWYYYGADAKAARGVKTIGSKKYYFYNDGRMLEDEAIEINVGSTTKYYIADEDGILSEAYNNTWAEAGDKWYYVQNGSFCRDGVYKIGGKYYGFNWDCQMYSDTSFSVEQYDEEIDVYTTSYYRAQKNGVLYQSAWVESEGSWYYYGADFKALRGIQKIGGKRYAFDYDGEIITDQIYFDSNSENYYLLTKMNAKGNGGSICEEVGWQKIDGNYVYVTNSTDKHLHMGWMWDKYYMTPYMSYCTIQIDEKGNAYSFNVKGAYKKITTTGFIQAIDGTYYLKSGKAVKSDWVKTGGYWYYFDEDGMMCRNGSYEIKGKNYFFDDSGKLWMSGWIRSTGGDWYWANSAADGALLTGVDKQGYVFYEDGRLVVDGTYLYNGKWYITNKDGKSIGSFADKKGWYQVGNNWYFVNEYHWTEEETYTQLIRDQGYYDNEKNRYYSFDYKGAMRTNQIYDGYYFGANGWALTGWRELDGKWYYGDPEDYGWLFRSGVYTINGKEYLFDYDRTLVEGKTVYMDGRVITTNSSGVVTKNVAANGWSYDGQGSAYYYKNGLPYDGWLGSYYIDDGYMCIDDTIYDEKTEKRYYVDKKGKKATGWHELWGDWIYARSDGTLAENEWIKLNNKWYYFSDIWMVCDGIYKIKGEYHEFDENGVWLGKRNGYNEGPDFSGKADGWLKYKGEWYFIMAGEAVYGSHYIDGKWYLFKHDGTMVSNRFERNFFDYYENMYYYTANGSRASYTGWKEINGKWVYFNTDHSVRLGWVNDGGNYYYISGDWYIDEEGKNGEYRPGMVTGYQAIGDRIYYFNGKGILTKTVTASGWYQVGDDWYYVDATGKLVSDEGMYKIGNYYYAFDYDGAMVSNNIWGDVYYGANGRAVTKTGWYKLDGEWIYVTEKGKAAGYGVYLIGGKEYYFYEYNWIQ